MIQFEFVAPVGEQASSRAQLSKLTGPGVAVPVFFHVAVVERPNSKMQLKLVDCEPPVAVIVAVPGTEWTSWRMHLSRLVGFELLDVF